MRSSGTVGCGAENRYTFTWMRLFSGEGRGNRSLASRLSLAARLSRPRPDSGRPRPPRCESVTVITGTPSHRYGYRGGGAARDRAVDGTAGPGAQDEAPGNRWPGHVLIRQRSFQTSRTHGEASRTHGEAGRSYGAACRRAPALTGTPSHRADRRPSRPSRGPGFRFSQLTMCFMCSGFRLGLMDLDVTDALQCP